MGQGQSIPNEESPLMQTNDLVQQVTSALVCGPECQAEQTNAGLLTQYHSAQIDMLDGPDKLGYTANSYYSYAKGPSAGRAFNEGKLKNLAENIANKYSSEYTSLSDSTHVLNQAYQSDVINTAHAQDLYESYLLKNQKLRVELDNTLSDVATNDRKSFYEDQQLDTLIWYYKWHLLIYGIILLSFFLSFFFVSSSVGFFTRIGIFIGMILYLFYAKYVVIWLLQKINYIVSFFPKNVYLTL